MLYLGHSAPILQADKLTLAPSTNIQILWDSGGGGGTLMTWNCCLRLHMGLIQNLRLPCSWWCWSGGFKSSTAHSDIQAPPHEGVIIKQSYRYYRIRNYRPQNNNLISCREKQCPKTFITCTKLQRVSIRMGWSVLEWVKFKAVTNFFFK